MSIKVMTAVWDRFEDGGGMLNLALALADFSDDSGGSIWPSVRTLARKTRQSERTVQRQLAELRARGWLIVDALDIERGGRGRTALYHISPEWLQGSDTADTPGGDKLTPSLPVGGVTDDAPGVTEPCHPRGDTDVTLGGDIAVSPNPSSYPSSYPSDEPSEVLALASASLLGKRPKKTREGKRLPENFELTPTRQKFAEQENIDPVRTFAMFRDHWRAAAGKGATKCDWDAAWRFWCRREAEFKRNRPGAAGGRASHAQIEADMLRKLKGRRHGMTRGMSNFRDPYRGESSEDYRRAMDAEWDRREPPSVPRFQQNAQQVGPLVAKLAASKRAPS